MKILLFLVFFSFTALGQNVTEDGSADNVGARDMRVEMAFTEAMKSFLTDDHKKAVTEFKEIIGKFGDNASVFYMLSKSENALNFSENAIVSAKKSTELDKENFYYQQNYADLLIKNQRFKEVVPVLKKQIKLKPNNPISYFHLADVLMIEGKESDVIKIFNQMEEVFGVNEEITQKKQVVLLKQNKVDAALKEGNKLVKNDPEYVKNQVQIMISNNRYDDALKLLESAVVDNPNFFEAYSTISEIYLKQEDKNKSKQNFEKILNIQSIPYTIKIQVFANYLGIFKNNLDEKELNNFIVFATQIINQNPTEAKTFVYLGDLNIKNKKPKEGRDAYLKAVTIDPSIFEAWLAVIELDAKLNLIDDLIKHSEKAIEFYPNQPYFWYHNGFGHKLKKNYNDAVVSFEEARNLSVQNNELKNHINAQLGDVYQELKKYDKSENAYEAVLKVNPNHEQTLNNYSYFLANRKKNLERAAELAKRLVELYPKQPVYLDTQAWVTYNAGNYAKANEIIDKAIGLNANPSAGILEHKGDILFKLGQKEVAIDFWKKALIQSPENKILERKTKEGNLIE